MKRPVRRLVLVTLLFVFTLVRGTQRLMEGDLFWGLWLLVGGGVFCVVMAVHSAIELRRSSAEEHAQGTADSTSTTP